MLGELVGNFRIVSELGRGGMGVVYRAEHVQLGRPAAVKMLQPQFTDDDVVVQRFFNEARAASAVDHPGIVEVYDYGMLPDGRAYLVMALLDGETLSDVMERGWIAPHEAVEVIAQAASALAATHAAGIVHRDLKPDNIILVPDPHAACAVQVKILDFGIAKLADPGVTGFKTETGVVIGTPLYMSPEQCRGAPEIDHRTDLYSLGCILYHLLAGRPPFEAAWAGAILAAQLRDEPPDPRTFVASIPEDLVHIVMRLLAKDPAARFQSALELRAALTGAPAGAPRPVTAPRVVARSAPTTATGAAAQILPIEPPRRSAGRTTLIGFGALAVALGVALAARSGERQDVRPARPPSPSSIAAPADAPPPVVRSDPTVTAAPPPLEPRPRRAPAPPRKRFTIAATRYAPHARLAVRFPSLGVSTPTDRAWLAIVEVGAPPPPYEAWRLVENSARTVTLEAPGTPGTYELRLYANDLRLHHAVRFVVGRDATDGARSPSPSTQPRGHS